MAVVECNTGGNSMGEIWMYIDRDGDVVTHINWYPSHEATDKFIAAMEDLKAIKTPEEIVACNEAIDNRNNAPKEEQSKALKKDKRGYIYVLRSQSLYKIGRSKRKGCRLNRYRTENPHEVEPILVIGVNDYLHQEAVVLSMFKSKQHRGEWFNLDRVDIETIREYLLEAGGKIIISKAQ